MRTLPEHVAEPASIKSLRDAVTELGVRGMQNVNAVREAFTSGLSPLQTFSSGSKSDFINRFAASGSSSDIIRSTAQFGLHTAMIAAPAPPTRPELDFIEIGTDRLSGVLDCFFARLVISMENVDTSKISYFRILRAKRGQISAPTPSFSSLADSSPIQFRAKSQDALSNAAFRIAEMGVGNALSNFVYDDVFSGQRSVVSSSSLRPLPPIQNTNRQGGSAASLLSMQNGDRSVVENVTFYVNQRTSSPRIPISIPLSRGQRNGLNVLQGSSIGSNTSISPSSNHLGFAEVARIPVSRGRQVGTFTEFEYIDPSVIYGVGYSYFVVAVSHTGFSSIRSRIVSVDIIRNEPPATPNVMFSVIGGIPRFSVLCSGSFTDHLEVFRKGGNTPASIQLLSTRKAMIDRGVSLKTNAGFNHIGDVGIGSMRSMSFADRNVTAGQSLDYRIYTVDSFGLKSSTPFSCSIYLPDNGRVVPLGMPSITAEQAVGDRIVRISVSCDDPRVISFALSRRELSTNERIYRQATHPSYFTLGSTTALRARSRSGPAINQFSSRAWNGVMQFRSGSVRFDDTLVEFDRVYQYSVHGLDIRGNMTSDVSSIPIFIAAKPISDPPTGLTGTLRIDSTGTPIEVIIEWIPGTTDFSPLDLMGDQDVLAATSQRSVFQVERREAGTSLWKSMPATTASYFIDPVLGLSAPKFRPGFPMVNTTYDYRVIAMQSGAFISTHTDPIRIAVVPDVLPPDILFVRSTQMAVRPLSIVLSWQYDGIFIDGWEIERAVTNKLFGARIPSMDSSMARGLSYETIGRITRESSRGIGVSSDKRVLDPRFFGGNRSFIDRDVSMANSYFYRIRSLDMSGRYSVWTYGGILLTDSPFDRKFMSTLSDDDRFRLVFDSRPVQGWSGR